MRCDVNISVRNSRVEGKRVEVKNVSGVRFVEKVIEYEIIR
jgi:Asp-tRNA(Asn)/Glu-tRNA(Gln) amidotransferase B subunit